MNNELNQVSSKHKSHKAGRAILTLVAIVGTTIGAMFVGPRAIDALQAQAFTPTSQVANVRQRLELTDRGGTLFYASSPQIEDKATFNTNCQSNEKTTAILGCYWKRQIHLFDIQNKELDGTLEVTAAHEMLHAAYERLGPFARKRVDTFVQAEYDKHRDDPELKQIMQYYAMNEPGAELNELHSIIGTTVASISPELEAYYAQYFHNRADIVALNTKYNAVFSSISKQASELQAKIKATEPVIKADLASYDESRQQIESDIQAFNAKAKSGGFATQSAFNAARSALSNRLAALNAQRDSINARVAEFNKLVEQLNALAVRADQLNESINAASSASGV